MFCTNRGVYSFTKPQCKDQRQEESSYTRPKNGVIISSVTSERLLRRVVRIAWFWIRAPPSIAFVTSLQSTRIEYSILFGFEENPCMKHIAAPVDQWSCFASQLVDIITSSFRPRIALHIRCSQPTRKLSAGPNWTSCPTISSLCICNHETSNKRVQSWSSKVCITFAKHITFPPFPPSNGAEYVRQLCYRRRISRRRFPAVNSCNVKTNTVMECLISTMQSVPCDGRGARSRWWTCCFSFEIPCELIREKSKESCVMI